MDDKKMRDTSIDHRNFEAQWRQINLDDINLIIT